MSWITKIDYDQSFFFDEKKAIQSAPRDGLRSISFTHWANEEAQQTGLRGVKVKAEWSKKDNKERRGEDVREEEISPLTESGGQQGRGEMDVPLLEVSVTDWIE